MSDGSISVQSSEIWGYEPQGSIEIAAPGALRAVDAERKRRKIRPPRLLPPLRRQTAPVLYVRRRQRDGKRDYKLSTETGQVQTNLIKVSPRVSPTEVKSKIESALKRSAQLDANSIIVEANGGDVVLRGSVGSWAEREEAERAAWLAPGVTKLQNNITLSY